MWLPCIHARDEQDSHGCTREASAKVKQSDAVNFSTCPDTAVRQAAACGLVGGEGMTHWKGERTAGVKKKNCPSSPLALAPN